MSDAATLLLIDSLLCFVIVVLLLQLQVSECGRCPHCQAEKKRKADEQQAQWNRFFCSRCGTDHPEGKHVR